MAISNLDFAAYGREDLERAAIEACGADQYYDLLDCIDQATNEQLKQMIIDGADISGMPH